MSEKGRRKKTEREIVYAMEIIAGFLLLAGFAAQLAVICARPVSGLWGPWLVGAWIAGGIDENQPAAALPKPVAGMAGSDAASFAMAGFRTGGVREWPDSGLECL